jgi:hypothetical protein
VTLIASAARSCGSPGGDTPPAEAPKPAAATEPAGKKHLDLGIFTTVDDGQGWYKVQAREDVVADELNRKFDIRFTERVNCQGMTAMERFSMLYATNELPAVLLGGQDSGDYNLGDIIQKMLAEDMLWTFTDAELKAVAPHAYAAIGDTAYQFSRNMHGTGDKNVGLQCATFGWTDYTMKEFPWRAGREQLFLNWESMIRIRDDILKEIIPTAKTTAELKEIAFKNGKLTWDDVRVPELDTYQGFVDFLYKVQEKYKGTDIIPYGPDMEVMHIFNRIFLEGALCGDYDAVKNDVVTNIVERQPEFLAMLKDLNKMYNDGVIYLNFAIDQGEQYDEKANAGRFAALKSYGAADANNILREAGEPYQYRRVPVSYDTGDRVIQGAGPSETARCHFVFLINKKKLPDLEDVKRLMSFWDYQATYEGRQLLEWGPESAGLWKIENGERKFTAPDVIANLQGKTVYGTGKDIAYYGLSLNTSWKDEYFQTRLYLADMTGPLNADVPEEPESADSIDLDYEINMAAQELVKAIYDDNYAAWNGSTVSNESFWGNWGTNNEVIAKAVMAKPANFDKAWAEVLDHFYNVVGIEEYCREQKGYIDFIKPIRDSLRFHPNADMSVFD